MPLPFAKGAGVDPRIWRQGRPRIDDALRKQCKDFTPEIVKRLQQILMTGEDGDAIKAGALMLAYGWGKPKERPEEEPPDTVEGEVVLPEGMTVRDALALLRDANK